MESYKTFDVIVRVRVRKEVYDAIKVDLVKYNYDISKLIRDCLDCFLKKEACKVRKKLEEEKGTSRYYIKGVGK